MATSTPTRSRAKAKPEPEAQEPSQAKLREFVEGTDPNHVLSIELAPERPYLTIDGQRHVYRLLQDFGSIEHQEFNRHSEEYDELFGTEKLNRDQRKRYDYLLEWLLDHVLIDAKALREQLKGDDPQTGQPKLTGGIKREVVVTFSSASGIKSLTQTLLDKVTEAITVDEARDTGSTPES